MCAGVVHRCVQGGARGNSMLGAGRGNTNVGRTLSVPTRRRTHRGGEDCGRAADSLSDRRECTGKEEAGP